MALNDTERLDKINKQIEEIKADKDKKIKQLKAQERAILARQKEKERKERTRRLIQIGAIFDSIGIDTLDKANSFKNEFDNDEKCRNWINKILQK